MAWDAISALSGIPRRELTNFQLISSACGFDVFRNIDGQAGGEMLLVAQGNLETDIADLKRHVLVSTLIPEELAQGHAHLVNYGGRLALSVRDPGGQPLQVEEQSAMSLEAFLCVAISIVDCLDAYHRSEILHGGIRPDNMLYGDDGVHFLSLAHSSIKTDQKKWQVVGHFNSATLPYVAPEQTGRLDGGVDFRADMYSLGVTLYELLTGELPFRARTPAEWIHAHLAKTPLPPGRWKANIPSMVASLIMRLMSKAPEERYQTTAGLKKDLQRCLDGFVADGRIGIFDLGNDDRRDTLILPSRLYGRDAELAALEAKLVEFGHLKQSKIVFMSAPAGGGKSAIARTFLQNLDPNRFHIVSGKFDQYNHLTPYATFISGLRALIGRLKSSGEVSGHIPELKHALSLNGILLTRLIPELSELVGEQPLVQDLPPAEAQARFQKVLARFISVFATSAQPLVLFLDDMQWMDTATSDFIETIIGANTLQVFVVGAVRDDEVDQSHPLNRWLQLSGPAFDVSNIRLADLDIDNVKALVADTLGAPVHDTSELAEVAYSRSAGNPLYVSQWLVSLVHKGLLSFDRAHSQWVWNAREISDISAGDIEAMMAWKIGLLADTSRSVVTRIALLGQRVDRNLLKSIFEAQELEKALVTAQELGIMTLGEETVSFFHDRIREAAYNLIPRQDVSHEHLKLARDIDEAFSELDSDRVFDLAQQYGHALHLISNDAERRKVARLFLRAAKIAEQSSAFAAAAKYYQSGASLLSDKHPNDDDVLFDLQIGLADCLLVSGEPQCAGELLASLTDAGVSDRHSGRLAWSKVTFHTALSEFDAAIGVALEYLGQRGIHWCEAPLWADVLEEYEPIKKEIAADGIASRRQFPLSHSENAQILDVLSAALPPAFFTNENLVCLILCRMANISRLAGNTSSSALGYAYLGMVLGPLFGEYAAAAKFGAVALDMVAEVPLSRFRGRVLMTVAYHVLPYAQPIRSTRNLHHKALTLSQETGDMTYAGFCSCTEVSNLLTAGDALSVVERNADTGLALAKSINFQLISDIITTQLMFVRSLRGSTFQLGSYDDGAFDDVAFASRLRASSSSSIALCWYAIRRMQLFVFSGEYDEAAEYEREARRLLWTSAGHLEYVEYKLYSSIVLARCETSADQAANMALISENIQCLQDVAVAAPANFSAYVFLGKAELARLQGASVEALRFYDSCVREAEESGFVQIKALANELAAKLSDELSLHRQADFYRAESYEAYTRWGASGKQRQLEATYAQLGHRNRENAGSLTALAIDQSFDIQAVLRSSATVAGEAVQSKMIGSMMEIALQNAGAQRCRLIVVRQGMLVIEGESRIEDEGTIIDLREREAGPDVPSTLIWETLKSRDILNETSDMNGEEAGPHRHRGARLVVPLVTRGRSVGVFLFENELNRSAFSPARTAVIQLIAAQAAIALENASLEEKDSLLQEVHHRVKNNLQLISSLLNLQASNVSDPKTIELFRESRNRVRSMALVHENLYKAGNFARIEMSSHLRTLCGYLARSYAVSDGDVRLVIAIEDHLELDLDSAISCGLVVNELVSNALKHAFRLHDRGRINVSLSRLNAGGYQLVVEDDGIGFNPAEIENTSLGMQLVRDLVDQLRGSIRFESANGTRIAVIFNGRAR
jgi:predicted ATPase/two-component sensor histidine kinase